MGDKWDSVGRMVDLLWMKVGLDLGNCQDIAKCGLLICLIKIMSLFSHVGQFHKLGIMLIILCAPPPKKNHLLSIHPG